MNVRHPIFLIETECKSSIGCFTFIFYQKYFFYNKMDLRLFIFIWRFITLSKNIVLKTSLSYHFQIPLLKFSKFKQINQLLFPLNSSENHMFSDDFRFSDDFGVNRS